jgi:hypothetical protein
MKHSSTHVLRVAGVLALTLLTTGAGVLAEGDGDDPPPSCLDNVTTTFYASPTTIAVGQKTTISWNVHAGNCPVTQTIGGVSVLRSGSREETPSTNATWTLTVRLGSRTRRWTASVAVTLPKDEYGRINVTITSNDQLNLFLQAISSQESTNAIVRIQDHVRLDLSYKDHIHIAPGVQILGGRTSNNLGPLLFTTSFPAVLFDIGQQWNADNVRISGIRLQGADTSVADEGSPGSIGIYIDSSLNVEIDNSEIYGWHSAAVSVHDQRSRIDRRNGKVAVRIHDNEIHGNQRIGSGYGVESSDGAYARVERNSFDNNRHAMASDGDYGTGYFFYRNFVFRGGGHHEVLGGLDISTHQIDMHGQDDCWGADGYCGVAGEYMDIRYNTITYTAGTAIKLRGTPIIRMDVSRNVFSHSDVWGNWVVDDGAMEQTDGFDGIHQWDNTFGVDPLSEAYRCDFDGDRLNDYFFLTGENWWMGSDQGRLGFRYLNASTRGVHDITAIGDVNGDDICDVTAGNLVSLGGRTPITPLARTDIVSRNSVSGALRISHLNGGVVVGEDAHPVWLDRDVVGTGDFDGDGDTDILLRKKVAESTPGGHGPGRATTILFLQDGVVASQSNWGYSPPDGGVAGIADFDGDGTSDVLWRDQNGRLIMWYWGIGAPLEPSHRNSGKVVTPDWNVKAVGDFNGDGFADIAWRRDDGQVGIWLMAGHIFIGELYPLTKPGLDWKIEGAGDFDSDGRSDLLWRNQDGGLAIWFKGEDSGTAYPTWRNQGVPTGVDWQIKGVSDFNSDGRADILWQRRTDGFSSIWMMNGGSNIGESPYFLLDTSSPIQGLLPIL